MYVCMAAGVINPVKIDTKYDLSDFLTKELGLETHNFHASMLRYVGMPSCALC